MFRHTAENEMEATQMNMKKLLCMVLAMLMVLATAALAESDDLQAQLDAANARVQELEAEVELYKPYYEAQIVAEYGEGGIVWLEDAQTEYEAAASAYAQYGLSIDDYADQIKQDILENLVQHGVLHAKAAELGLDQIDDDTRAELEAQAQSTYDTYVENYKSYFASEDASDEDARAQTIAAMDQYGITVEALTEQTIESYLDEQLYNHVTEGVEVTDDEVQAKYDAMVAEAEEDYANDYTYNTARNSGTDTIAWNPEGYRAVKHVLIKFDDEQAKQYSDLQSTLSSLNAELDALDAPAEETEEAADDEEAAEPEETEAPRSREEIQADIGNIAKETEALYSQLLPQAQQVIDEFEAGADFDSLIEKYNADPGMTTEPTATNGYAVSADSTTWDPAFTEGAMAIESVGQISSPVYGQNGIHVIYYMSDITPGPVAFEDIADAVKDAALQDKISQTYDDQVAAWVEESAPVYHADRF